MNLGLALYGRSFTLASSQNTSIGAAIIEGGGEGKAKISFSIQGFILLVFSWSVYERRRNFSVFRSKTTK